MAVVGLIETVINKIVMPALIELDKEANQPIKAIVSILLDGSITKQEICTRPVFEANVTGEFKVILREGTQSNTYNYSVECILEGLMPETGFSGFVTRGKFSSDSNDFYLKKLARSNRYNVWSWGEDFMF